MQNTPLEIGQSVAANRTFIWSISNSIYVEPDTINITDVSSGVVLLANGENTGLFTATHAEITRLTPGENKWRITAQNTQGGAITRDYDVPWYARQFWGVSDLPTLDAAGVVALQNSVLAASPAGTRQFAAGGYKYFVSTVPLTSFRSNNFDVPFEDGYQVTWTNAHGVPQTSWVYRTVNTLGGVVAITAE